MQRTVSPQPGLVAIQAHLDEDGLLIHTDTRPQISGQTQHHTSTLGPVSELNRKVAKTVDRRDRNTVGKDLGLKEKVLVSLPDPRVDYSCHPLVLGLKEKVLVSLPDPRVD